MKDAGIAILEKRGKLDEKTIFPASLHVVALCVRYENFGLLGCVPSVVFAFLI